MVLTSPHREAILVPRVEDDTVKGNPMGSLSADGAHAQLPWLPDERFELGFDSQHGGISHSSGSQHSLTVTSHRAIQSSRGSGRKSTSLLPLDRVSSVEVVDVTRPATRLAQGVLFLGVGGLLGLVAWAVLEAFLFVLVAGGLPSLVGVYLLAGYLFPDDQGELVLHAPGYAMRVPLRSADARRDAYLVAHRLFELMVGRSASQVQDDAPQRASQGDADTTGPEPEVTPAAPPEAPAETLP